MAAAAKRPELSGLSTSFLPSVPQVYRGCGPRQGPQTGRGPGRGLPNPPGLHGRRFCQLFQPLWPPVAGLCRGGGPIPLAPGRPRPFLRAQPRGQPVPLSALAAVQMPPGPEFTLRYNLFRSAQINGSAAPGYSSDQANQALEEVFAQTMRPEMGFDYMGMSFQEKAAAERRQARGRFRPLPAVCFSDSGGAL